MPVLSAGGELATLRVLLVDGDEPQAARTEAGLRASMRGALTVERVGTMAQAIRALTTSTFDIVVLELSVRDASGIATLAGVRGAAPATPIVVYAAVLDDALALRALRAGAQECLSKAETEPTRLGRALLFAMERHRRLRSLEAERVEAAHRATHDALTGLANRELFLDHLEQALAFGSRYGRKTGILFVDLDGFKRINDLHGHIRGDALLRVVASRLIECVRRSDAVGRIGGDEFVVLLPDVTSRRDVAHVRETILSCLREPVDVGNGHMLMLDASVGGAMSPLDGHTAQALLDAADTEMYREKHQRRREREGTPLPGSVAAVGDGTSERVGDKVAPEVLTHRREARLREAVRAGEFEVHFQPIVDVPTARFHGAEALLRWRDPDRGLLLPESFLALAEDTGLIVPLGEMVLRQSCRSVVAWRSVHGASTCRVAVNISAVQLRERGFVRQVAAILAETGCPADALTLELTENSMLVDGEIAIEALRELKALGTRLVVDDFGVGFASLTFVREAPIDGIKLDRRFVAGILRDSRDEAIIAAIIRLAQGLQLDITAEGVESAEQAVRLTNLQCFKQQGQYFSHPLTTRDIDALLSEPGVWSFDPRARRPTSATEIEGRAIGRGASPKHLFG